MNEWVFVLLRYTVYGSACQYVQYLSGSEWTEAYTVSGGESQNDQCEHNSSSEPCSDEGTEADLSPGNR